MGVDLYFAPFIDSVHSEKTDKKSIYTITKTPFYSNKIGCDKFKH